MRTSFKRTFLRLFAALASMVVPALAAADDPFGAAPSAGPSADDGRGTLSQDPLSGDEVRPDERLAEARGVEVQLQGRSERQPESVAPPPGEPGASSSPQPCTPPEAERTDAAVRQVSGRIVQTKTVEIRGTGQRNLVALIDTERGHDRVVVDLGPVTSARGLNLARGSHVAIEGRVHRVGDRPVLVADRVRVGERVARIDRPAQREQHAELEGLMAERRASLDVHPMMP